MTFRGRVKPDGLIELEPGMLLPAGSEVAVRLVRRQSAGSNGRKSLKRAPDRLMQFAGKAKGLPKDAARNLDRYLYGRPKR